MPIKLYIKPYHLEVLLFFTFIDQCLTNVFICWFNVFNLILISESI